MDMHIMLFDDHKLFAKSLEIAMKELVGKFETFSDTTKAVEIVEKRRPDVILMDVHMGEVNGLEVARAILERFPDQKLLFLSGYDLVEYCNQAIKMGARGFINKSVSIHDLADQIRRVAEGAVIFPKHENKVEPLTDREKEILQLTAEGLKQQEVADRLYISRRTVNNHLQTINDKLGVHSTVTAIIRGIELGSVKLKRMK
ncbi:response regulator [Paenibacillus sp. NPDC058071]|uniref:response regulator n=1 Tax=Paenibacillus sp. NPDC058071 TaxID=3346326 RepID=UPI0036DA8C5B